MSEFGVTDGIDENVCALCGSNGVEEVVFTGVLFAVTENDKDLSPLAEAGEFFRDREIDGVIERGSELPLFVWANFGEIPIALVESVNPFDDLGARGGEVADEAKMIAKADGKGLVLRLENLLKEDGDILFMLLEKLLLTPARVDDQANAERKSFCRSEEADSLRDTVFSDCEVRLREAWNDLPLGIVNADSAIDQVSFNLDRRDRLRAHDGCESKEQCRNGGEETSRGVHLRTMGSRSRGSFLPMNLFMQFGKRWR